MDIIYLVELIYILALIILFMENEHVLLDTTRISKSKSLRMSLPKRVAARLGVGQEDILGFFVNGSNEIVIRKLK